jgi:hypothetical protein
MNRLFIIAIAFVLLLFSCGRETPTPTVALSVRVREPDDTPVLGAAVQVDRKIAGRTSAQGVVETTVSGKEGRQISVTATCPEGCVASKVTATVTMRVLRPVGDNRAAPVPLTADLVCTPTEQQFVLVVKTDARTRIPVIAQGRIAGYTDEDGTAQTVIRGAVGEEIEVVLNTESSPELLPQFPSRRLFVPQTPKILVFEQQFKKQKKARRKKRRVQRGPHRI